MHILINMELDEWIERSMDKGLCLSFCSHLNSKERINFLSDLHKIMHARGN